VKLSKSKVNQALDMLAKEATVLVPMNVDGVSKFAPWGTEGELALDIVNTLLPPKDALFPQTEKMYKYKVGAETAEVKEVTDSDKQVVFGLRSCDMHSIDCMDAVFLTKGYVDNFYSRKRENLTTIAINCTKSNPTCFCDSMGVDPNNAASADMQLIDIGDAYVVEARTEKGKAVEALWQPLLEAGEGTATPISCELKLDMAGLPAKLRGMFESDIWNDGYQACIGCGTCTYICPTCYCFDINAENHGQEGAQFRCWDSCMFSEYTRMAGGHNPRPSKKERLRNRFMHKLAYFDERYNKNLCAGCGRCVVNCPVNIDITRFIEKVKEVPVNG